MSKDSYEATDDIPIARPMARTLEELWRTRLNRRTFLKTSSSTAALTLSGIAAPLALSACSEQGPSFNFTEIEHGVDHTHHVAPDHEADILIRWGDPVTATAPPFDPENQSAAAQAEQFGYNNDFVGFIPLPFGSELSDRALLCVNHEFTNDDLMHRVFGSVENPLDVYSREIAEISMAAHGGSVLEIARNAAGKWKVVTDSPFNRRITASTTEMEISGPAAGHPRLQTSKDPSGRSVIGTFNNCAGGITPWGTYLMAEENIHGYFMGSLDGHPEARNYARFGIPSTFYPWGAFDERFDINKEPNEANRFGWIVEVDPFDPLSRPVKRTALGRFKHEGCETALCPLGRVVVYSGDDQTFEYLYRFVSDNVISPDNREANFALLDNGTLSVARFEEDGTGTWLPLVHGNGPLTAENGFESQADVLIETRRAADLLGATPLDRPEDVQPNLLADKVYVALTNNAKRTGDQTDAVNPRGPNFWGQIVELAPEAGNHAAAGFTWNMLVVCGDPDDPAVGAQWNDATSENGWFSCPDNLAVDPAGRLWAATDQGQYWARTSGTADGIWAIDTQGALRGKGTMFFRAPVGAEMSGPRFSSDGETFFVAVQHPGADGTEDFAGFERKSTFADPATRWPDFKPGMPPRPSVVAISRKGGGRVG
ncbi:MAG: PhoX family phosphatase [Parvibaculaceae bacterium]